MNNTYTKPAEIELKPVYGFDLNAVCHSLDCIIRDELTAQTDADVEITPEILLNCVSDSIFQYFDDNESVLAVYYYFEHAAPTGETPNWLNDSILKLCELIMSDQIPAIDYPNKND